MFYRTLAAVLLASMASGALCQTPASQPAQSGQLKQITPVPDYVLWDAFFFRVNWLNDLADKLDAKGQNGSQPRSEIAQRAHLSSQQQQALNGIAVDYRTVSQAMSAQVAALRKSAPGSSAQQISDLQNQMKQMVLDHVSQLQAAFADNVRFEAFKGYVRGTESVKVYGPAQIPQPAKEQL